METELDQSRVDARDALLASVAAVGAPETEVQRKICALYMK